MNSRMAVITFMDDSGSGRPDNSLPGGGSLPPGAVQLPVFPFDPTVPDNTLPGGSGGRPDNTLPPGVDNTLPGGSGGHPSGQPIVPGRKFIVKWLACTGLILVPDNTLPPTPEPK